MFVCAPIDLVKVRLQGQTSAHRYRGPIHCVSVILKEEGPRGLFRGGLALALRDVPCYGLYFLPYEVTRMALTGSGKESGQFRRDWHNSTNPNGALTHIGLRLQSKCCSFSVIGRTPCVAALHCGFTALLCLLVLCVQYKYRFCMTATVRMSLERGGADEPGVCLSGCGLCFQPCIDSQRGTLSPKLSMLSVLSIKVWLVVSMTFAPAPRVRQVAYPLLSVRAARGVHVSALSLNLSPGSLRQNKEYPKIKWDTKRLSEWLSVKLSKQ